MGDILSGVFGGGEQTEQKTTPDATQQALNTLRLDELQKLFRGQDISRFAQPNKALTRETAGVRQLRKQALDKGNFMSLDDYISLGLDQGSNYISQIASPEIKNSLALQGQENSGALPESIARATASIGLPFVQSIPGAAAGFAQQATNLTPLADYPRQLRENEFLRQQGVVTTGLTGLPFAPGQTTEGGTSSLPLWNLFGTGGSL